jgi:hypothetical protein
MRGLISRLERIEEQNHSELQRLLDVETVMEALLSHHPPWAARLKQLGHPRRWPENAGRWSADTNDLDIANDLYCALLDLPEGKSAFVSEPWNIGDTIEDRWPTVRRAYFASYHGPDAVYDYAAGLEQLIAMRPDWVELHRKHGAPQNWPENKGRWRKNEHPHVITFHLAKEWENEWERYYHRVAPGLGWFLVRIEKGARLPDPPYPCSGFFARDNPRGVA